MLNVIKLSKFTYSMLTVLGFVGLLIGTQLFNKYLKEMEYRKLFIIEAVISIVMAPLTFMFVLRLNLDWGIPDLALIIFTDTVSDIIGQCFVFLPMSVIMSKICPKHIEATSFALLAGVSNFRATIRSWTGSIINDRFVGVTEDDLSQYWVLCVISFVCSFLPLLFLWLVPTKQQINDLQASMKESEDDKSTDKEMA